jgi:hypothetical protein
LYKINKNHPELRAWISLYQFLIESQDENLQEWQDFCKDLTAKQVIRLQKEFIKDLNTINYNKLYRPALKLDGTIVKLFRSFAISYCSGAESVEVDFLADGLATFSDNTNSVFGSCDSL